MPSVLNLISLLLLGNALAAIGSDDDLSLVDTGLFYWYMSPGSPKPAGDLRHQISAQGGMNFTRFYSTWTERLSQSSDPTPLVGTNLSIGLMTFPNSGTSWLMDMVSDVTGIRETTLYDNKKSEKEGIGGSARYPSNGTFPGPTQSTSGSAAIHIPLEHGSGPMPKFQIVDGEKRSPTHSDTILVKDHGCCFGSACRLEPDTCNYCMCPMDKKQVSCLQQRISEFDGIIRLVRNPLDNIYARYHLGCWMSEKHDPNYCSTERLKQRHGLFSDFSKADINKYVHWHCTFREIEAALPSLTIVYENMVKDPIREIQRVVRFMGKGDMTAEELRSRINPKSLPQKDKAESAKVNFIQHRSAFSPQVLQYIHDMVTRNFLHN